MLPIGIQRIIAESQFSFDELSQFTSGEHDKDDDILWLLELLRVRDKAKTSPDTLMFLYSLLHAACKSNRMRVLEWIKADELPPLENTFTRNTYVHLAVLACCRLGRIDALRHLCDNYSITANMIRWCNNQALVVACQFQHLDIANFLRVRFMLEAEDVCNDTLDIFRYAASQGRLDMIKRLINMFAVTVSDFETARYHVLNVAACNGHLDIVEFLIGWIRFDKWEIIFAGTFQKAHKAGRKHIVDYLRHKYNLHLLPDAFDTD